MSTRIGIWTGDYIEAPRCACINVRNLLHILQECITIYNVIQKEPPESAIPDDSNQIILITYTSYDNWN